MSQFEWVKAMLYPGQESAQLEFKREVPGSYFSIIKTVIGFCNLYGGKIVIGVADDAKIVGLSEDKIGKNIDALQQAIFGNCSPLIAPNIYSQRIELDFGQLCRTRELI